jgi:hypothetical protein
MRMFPSELAKSTASIIFSLRPISSSSTVLGSVWWLLVCGCKAEAQEEEGDGDEFGLPGWAIN